MRKVKSMPAKPRLVFIGPLPPPVHGMAAVNADILNELRLISRLYVIDVKASSLTRGPLYHVEKGFRAILALPLLLYYRAFGARTLYTSADDGLGGVWRILHVLVARLLGFSVFIHHHSYKYLLDPTLIMALTVRISGAKSTHIVLCDKMADVFRVAYPRAATVIVVGNSVEVPDRSARTNYPGRIRLGFLANITFEKGISEFVDLIRALRSTGADVVGACAGPLVLPAVREYLEMKLAEPSLPLKYIGPVYGADKEKFFNEIDILVFPTKYKTESFGLVLLEGLIRGVPVIAYNRGCICIFSSSEAAKIIDTNQDFVSSARSWIEENFLGSVRDNGLSLVARNDGHRINRLALESRRELFGRLVPEIKSTG